MALGWLCGRAVALFTHQLWKHLFEGIPAFWNGVEQATQVVKPAVWVIAAKGKKCVFHFSCAMS